MRLLFLTFALLMSGVFSSFSQNNTCLTADPFCTGTTYNFPAGVNAGSAQAGPDYTCLYTQPNPAWYYMQVANPGTITIEMHSTPQVDIDFTCWGPFSSPTAPCVAQLTAGNTVDCSYSTSWTETCDISNAQTGQYYILLITNYSNSPCNIIFSQVGGGGSTNCGIVAPPVAGDTVCVGQTIQLTVNNPVGGATYNWTGPNGWTSTQMNPTISNATTAMSGTYSLTITLNGQVSPAVTCTVLVNPNPVITVTPSNTSVCPGASATLTPSSSTGTTWFVWSDGSQGTGAITVAPTVSTTYTVTGTDLNGCTGTASAQVDMSPNLVISVTPPNPTICENTSANLTAGGATNYTWDPLVTVNDSSGQNVTAGPLTATTTYTVTGTNPDMCSGTTTVTVNVNPPPAISVSASPPHICPGDSSMLQVAGVASNFTWTPNSGLSSVTGSSVYAQPITTTTYTVSADNAGCVSTAEITLIVSPVPTIDFTSDVNEGCQGLTVHFTDLTTPAVQNWFWNFGDNIPYGNTSILQNPFHYYADPGSYDVSLSVVSVDGCEMTMTYPDFITVYPNPIAEFTINPEIANELDPLIFFNNVSIGSSLWHWNFGDEGSINNDVYTYNPTHVYSDTGTFYITMVAITEHGCTDTAVHYVIIEPNIAFYVPNAFTPNADAKNPNFRPYGEGIDPGSFEMKIYDRWGTLILLTKDMETGWDGKYNGKASPPGVYTWYINYTDHKYQKHSVRGLVTLIR